VSATYPSSELDPLKSPTISKMEGRCLREDSVSTTLPSCSGQFPRVLPISVDKMRFANLVFLCTTLLVCASAGAASSPVAVVTDQTALNLSNRFGVPFGGTVNQSGDYGFLGNGATAVFFRHTGSSTVRLLQVGDPIPGITGSQVVFFNNGGGINSNGHAVFAVRFSLNDGFTHTALETYDGTNFHTVVLSTDIAPTTGGKAYGAQIIPIGIDDNGDIAFRADLIPFAGAGDPQRTLFIVPAGGSVTRVVGVGDAVAAPAGTIANIRLLSNSVNALGQVLFFSRVQQTGGGIVGALFVGSASGVQKVVAGGDPAPGGGNFMQIGNSSAFLNNSGKVAFSVFVSPKNENWLWTAPSTLTLVAGSGDPAPPSVPGGGTLASPFVQGIDDTGDILINSVVTGGTTTGALLRYHTSGTPTQDLVAYNGETASGKTFQFVYFGTMANNGTVGFAVQLSTGGFGIYTQSGTSTPGLVVADGQATSLSGGGTFNLSHTFPVPGGGTPVFFPTATLIQTLNNGSVYFTSSVAGNTSGAFYGEFLGSASSITNLMSTADTLPAGARVSFLGGPDIVAAGHFVGFEAQQAGGLMSVFVTDRTSSTTTKLASEGDNAPSGLSGVLGNSVGLTELFVNSSGQVAFGASLMGVGAGRGIFMGSPSSALAKVVATGDSASSNSIFTFAQPGFTLAPMLNDSGQTAFLALTSNRDGIFSFTPGAGGGIAKIVALGDTAPDGSTFTALADNSNEGGPVVINAGGQVAFAADTTAGSGIFVGSAGNTLQKVVATGDSLAGGTVAGLLGLSSFNNSGTVAFAGSVTIPPAATPTNGLFVGAPGGALSTLALDGTIAPGTGGGTFSTQLFGVFSSGAVQINDEGDIAFRSGIGTTSSGYFRILQSDHTLRAIVLQGQAVPGGLGTFDVVPSPLYQGGEGFALGPDGAMVFSNNFVTGASVTETGDFGVTTGGTIFKIISAGDAVPGTGGGLLSLASPSFSLDGTGGFATFAEASGGTAREAVLWTSAFSAVPPTVFIDAPTAGSTIGGIVTVSGWAVDNSSAVGSAIASVQVKVDGNVVGAATYGLSRADVCAVFPGRPGCPNVGYSFSLNTSSFSAGSHTITVTATDSDGTPDSGSASVTVTVSATPPAIPPTVYIDAPKQGSTVGGTVTVVGWAIDNASAVGAAINSVQVNVDGAPVGAATYGISRADVCVAYPGRSGCPNVGFTFSLNTSLLTPGSHTITVTATDSDGTPDSGSSSVTVTVSATPPTVPPTVYIDAPAAGSMVSGSVTVVGWAIDNNSTVGTGISSVQVKVDGSVVGSATYGVSRPDVCVVYPGRAGCPNVGYTFSLNTSSLSTGSHTITVTATDNDGIPDSGSASVSVTK
jgi:Bacterial Ig domain